MSSTQDERTVLVALYDATGGTNWNNKTNWKTNQPFSEWYGVTTNADGQVIGLMLIRNELSGSIPVELAQLSSLKYLVLDDNKLSGSIPVELAQLSNLEYLSLGDNAGLYAPTEAEFQAWLTHLKEFSIDDLDQAEAQPPAESPGPDPARDDILLSDVDNDVSLSTIERLLDVVEPPSDPTQTLEFLESFLHLAKTFKKKVGSMGDGAANMQVFAVSIKKLQDDLTEVEETIAEVAKQTEDAAQQQLEREAKNAKLEAELDAKNKELNARNAELDAKNAKLEAELDAKNKELNAKNAKLEAKNTKREAKKAAFEERRSNLKKVKHLLAELELEIPRIEAAIQQINGESADLALRVDETGQKFHDAVEKFLQSQRQGFGIMGQIGDMLRFHHGDDAQILEALRQWEDSEQADLNTAIDLVNEIAENLGDLDRCLGALTKERDSTS